MNRFAFGRRLGLAAVVALALPLAQAQDAPSPEDRAARHLQQVQERLDLSTQQAALVSDAFAKRDPSALWSAAAQLAPTLSATQRARLTTPPERPARPERGADRLERADRPARAERQGRRERPTNAERGQRPDRSADHQAMTAARNAALGLRADQVAAFERLDAERRQQFEQRREQMQQRRADGQDRPDRSERTPRSPLPDEVAEILDADQETVWLTFQALTPHHGGPHGPRSDRN